MITKKSKSKLNTAIFFGLILTLTAQLNINFMITNFKIAISIVIFAVFAFLLEDFPIIETACVTSIGVFVSRVLIHWEPPFHFYNLVISFGPEVCFYLADGVMLYFLMKYKGERDQNNVIFLLCLVIIDYLSNFTELILRTGIDVFLPTTQLGILAVALIRTGLFWCLLTVMEHYHILLLRKEHILRYQRLILLISKLNGEMIWMRKNTNLIEDTMHTSYKLYEQLKSTMPDFTLAKDALIIARDIHEIKKEYLLILRGLSDALDDEAKYDQMYLLDMLEILEDSIKKIANENKIALNFILNCEDNPYITSYYAFLSVFRNLCTNAIEACEEKEMTITLSEHFKEGMYEFEIKDDGPGIPDENIEHIFTMGFSTKINYETGEVNRGMGLSLVKDLVTQTLGGTLFVCSRAGETIFKIIIPEENLEKSSFD
ncbi:MAG: sensor histidine kinase [Lachnospiraceae bacterium]|jgi:two-component system sensor histidine kinase YcbA|nr:sensor histidine kinase [Lachnospiraceae bacterium]